MLADLLNLIAAHTQLSDTADWWARAIGAAGLFLGLWTATQAARESYWKRRSHIAPELRDIVVDILNRLSGSSQKRGGVELLWTPKTRSDTDSLSTIAARTPDRALRKLLVNFESEVLRARGSVQPDTENPELLLGDAQLLRIEKARETGRKIVARLDKLARKAVQ